MDTTEKRTTINTRDSCGIVLRHRATATWLRTAFPSSQKYVLAIEHLYCSALYCSATGLGLMNNLLPGTCIIWEELGGF